MPNYTPSGTTSPPNATATHPNATATLPPVDCPHCLNGGTYVGGYCQCLAGYSGVYCEQAIYSPPGTYGKGHMCMFAGYTLSHSLPYFLSPLSSPSPSFSPPYLIPPPPLFYTPSLLHSLTPVHTCPTDLAYPCGECYNGTCDYASATCVCHPLYEGERCDSLMRE